MARVLRNIVARALRLSLNNFVPILFIGDGSESCPKGAE